MTVEELLAREAIRHTLASYNIFADRLRVDEVVALFTEDGVLELEGAERGQVIRHEGREAIGRFFGGMQGGGSAGRAPPADPAPAPAPSAGPAARMFVRHHLSTSRIEFTGPDTAEGRSYFAVYTPAGPDHCGVYVDKFRRTDAGWLIALRQPRVDWRSPDSLFGGRR